jgi:hypothetical protein
MGMEQQHNVIARKLCVTAQTDLNKLTTRKQRWRFYFPGTAPSAKSEGRANKAGSSEVNQSESRSKDREVG